MDTIHAQTLAIEEAVYPEEFGMSRTRTEVSLTLATHQLSDVLKRADKQTISAWMHDSKEYANDRQNFVFYCEDTVKRPAAHTALLELCVCAQARTKDPIFKVPLLLNQIRSKSDNNKRSQQAIKAQAKGLPLDHASMQIVGDALTDTHPLLAIMAFELGVSALEARAKKRKWSNPPYDYEPIAEHADYLSDNLADLYDQQKRLTEIDSLEERMNRLLSDDRTYETPPAQVPSAKDASGEQFKDDSVLNYLKWFDTLGIDLSGGDGQLTKFSTPVSKNIIGRNDPCPCGVTKPDGSPVKYKKCHGANI